MPHAHGVQYWRERPMCIQIAKAGSVAHVILHADIRERSVGTIWTVWLAAA